MIFIYLHLGNETVIRTDDIVAIFDIENTSVSKMTRAFLKNAEDEMRVTNVSNDLPKSFVVCEDKTGTRVYISQISPSTLKKRTGFIKNLENV